MAPSTEAHVIDGERVAQHGPALEVTDPASGELVGCIPDASPEVVARAVAAARRAAPDWARVSPGERAAGVRRAGERLRERLDEVAELQTREGGKPIADSRGGVEAGASTIAQYAELGPLHRGRALQGDWDAVDLMVRVPRGVAAVLVPWNDPVAVSAGLLAANVVAGNTVVFKPSEKTPLSCAAVAECFDHLPPGVVNLVLGGPAAGAELVGADVDLVVHTGSVRTGKEIAVRCAERLVKAVLELGGKDAMVVDADVDPAWAAEQAAIGAFANAGQICTSVERIYVHRSVAEPFAEALAARAGELAMGHGLEPATQLGPLIDDGQRDVVHGHVSAALDAGATLLAGGEPVDGPGSFYPATVLTDVPDDTALLRDETFGPVAAIRPVDSFDEGLALAAASTYGLAAVVLTRSQANAQRAWRELPVGTVKVNAAFGGAPGGAAEPHGQSGWGFGYGPELLDELTRTRVVHLRPGVGTEGAPRG
ncbi:MAG TPA: aldehyde dehydrogenase family protein [Aquihabitans sp.]|jgi:succinate-semialdehyde dehydrogenase/glutarate-semialdehyde dehydrogenase|nr:aldehyde dehydrogenase family protein [Aquihabitans sp.]